MAKDYYQVLGVSKTASADEIKAAFRKLAHLYHPDKAGGNVEKFKEVNEAYQVLSNQQKRAQYDQFGATFESAQRQGGYSGFEGFRDFSDFAEAFRGNGKARAEFNFGDLGDLFGDLFSRGGTRRQRRTAAGTAGSDVETEVTITLAEAAQGVERTLELRLPVSCERCRGSGAEPGSKLTTCSTCQGSGQVVRTIGFGMGVSTVCPTCGGAGKKPERVCTACRGQGSMPGSRSVRVRIPAGIDDGQAIRVSGQGQAGSRGGEAGDLYVRVRVKPDSRFTREGDDLRTEATVPFSAAALGTKLDVPTLTGAITLKIPEGTPSGKAFRVRGEGMPRLQASGRGDLVVYVTIPTPHRLSRKQRELLEELGREGL